MGEVRSQAAVLNAVQGSRTALEGLLASLSDEQMTQDGVMEQWSLKDVLAHITGWEQWMLRVIHKESEALAELAKMRSGDLGRIVDAMNAATHAANRQRPLCDVQAAFQASFREVVAQLAAVADADWAHLYPVVAANTFEHYDEHAQGVQAWLDSASARSQE
jgi:hypothetical protein